MKKEIADQWVAALRSGDYSQAVGVLEGADIWTGQTVGFCCLGVLSHLAVDAGVCERNRSQYGCHYGNFSSDNPLDWSDSLLSGPVRAWAGIQSRDGEFFGFGPGIKTLASLNDAGKTFSEIADIIEEYWQEL